MKQEAIFFLSSFFSLLFIKCIAQEVPKGIGQPFTEVGPFPLPTQTAISNEQPISIPSLLSIIPLIHDSKNPSNGANPQMRPVTKNQMSPTPIPTSNQVNVVPSANTAQNTAVSTPPVVNTNTPSQQSAENPPSFGSSNIPPSSPPQDKQPSLTKIAWKDDERPCIVVSGPSNTTYVQPKSVQRISWNQSPCQMSGQIVANFDILLYNNLRIVPKTMKRDFTPNGKLQYDWGPYSIAHNLSNITNNFDWTVPSIYNSRITNTSKFFIRVETISLSGIFGEQPPLGGTYGPFSMVLGDPSHPTASESSIASKITIKSNFISITNVNAVILWNLLFGGVLLAIALLSLNTLIL